MAAALLDDEQASDLALNLRCHQHCSRVCERLDPRRSVWCIAVNFPRRIDHHWAGFDTNARVERWLPRTGVLTINLSERALDPERRPRRTFAVVLVRERIAE